MKKTILTDEYIVSLKIFFDQIGFSRGQSILDIGANIGYTAMAYSAAAPGSEIIAFEPSAFNYDYLAFNTRQLALIAPQKIGLHDKRGKAQLRLPSVDQNKKMKLAGYSNTGLYSMYGKGEKVSAEIDLVTLDEWLEGYPKRSEIGFVKIDVEGNELNVLKGAEKFLAATHAAIELESNPETYRMSGDSYDSVARLLRKFGFAAYLYESGRLSPVKQRPETNVNLVFLKKQDPS